jgi:hypothetical protein
VTWRAARLRVSHARRGLVVLALVLAVAAASAGCASSGASFAPEGPCVADGRAPGTYPDLEAKVRATLDDRHATTVDSGRSCSPTALGALTSHGVTDLRFAGATWDEGGGAGTSIAVLGVPDGTLPVAWAEEFYEQGARTATKTDNIATSRPLISGLGPTFRVDALNDISFESVVVWQDGPLVRVALVASPVSPTASKAAHEEKVAKAVAAAATASGRAPALPASTPSTAP